MLLALILMATLVLGIVFSGWLTPTPGRAQQGGGGGGSNNENTNCPNYTYTTNVFCPSITNTPVITTPSLCLKVGDPVPDPSYAPSPGASSGGIVITTTETCSNTVTYSTNAITYTFGKIYYNPVKPSGLIAGTYSSECYIGVASSDTNDCPSPGPIDLGSVTWDVLSTNVTSITFDPQKTLAAINAAINIAETTSQAAGCSASTLAFGGAITGSWQYVCCSSTNGPYKKSNISGTITAGLTNLTCPVPGLSVTLPYPVSKYAKLGVYFTLNANANASASIGVAQPCQQQPICVNVGAQVKGAFSLVGGVDLSPYVVCLASATGSVGVSVQTSGPDNDGKCHIAANLGNGSVTWNITVDVDGFGCKPYSGTLFSWNGYAVTNDTDCLCISY